MVEVQEARVEEEIRRREGEFSRPHIGPLGRHIVLAGEAARCPALARLVEEVVGGRRLGDYLVTCDSDRRLLAAILGTVYPQARPGITTSTCLDTRHAVPRLEGREGAVPLTELIQVCRLVSSGSGSGATLGFLQVADPNVFNHLVDRQAVEAVVVCTTQALAKEVVAEGGVRGVTCAVTRDWYRCQIVRQHCTLQMKGERNCRT